MFGIGTGNADDLRDRAHIQVEDIGHWARALEIDEPTLRGAIQAVGFTAGDVRNYLKVRQAATPAA